MVPRSCNDFFGACGPEISLLSIHHGHFCAHCTVINATKDIYFSHHQHILCASCFLSLRTERFTDASVSIRRILSVFSQRINEQKHLLTKCLQERESEGCFRTVLLLPHCYVRHNSLFTLADIHKDHTWGGIRVTNTASSFSVEGRRHNEYQTHNVKLKIQCEATVRYFFSYFASELSHAWNNTHTKYI